MFFICELAFQGLQMVFVSIYNQNSVFFGPKLIFMLQRQIDAKFVWELLKKMSSIVTVKETLTHMKKHKLHVFVEVGGWKW